MDPEDMREVISAYQKCVAETVQRSGGFLAKYMGDGPSRSILTTRVTPVMIVADLHFPTV
jgi:class 3 adenylate cyclase